MRPALRPIWWDPGDWARFEMHPITLPTNTYALTEASYGGGGIRRGRVAHTGGAEGNDRRMYLLPEYDRDSRFLTVWQLEPLKSAGGAQIGQVIRARDDPDGFTRVWIVRHDFTFGQNDLLQVGIWRWPTTAPNSLSIPADVVTSLSALRRTVTAAAASRTGGVVTATGIAPANGPAAPLAGYPQESGLEAGHTVSADFPDATYDAIAVLTGAVTGATTATYADGDPDDPAAGAGTLQDLDGVLPLAVESILTGSTLAVRAWRLDQQPVPSWSDPTRALILRDTAGADPWPARRGRSGLYVGHLVGGGAVEFGYIERERYR